MGVTLLQDEGLGRERAEPVLRLSSRPEIGSGAFLGELSGVGIGELATLVMEKLSSSITRMPFLKGWSIKGKVAEESGFFLPCVHSL